MDWFKRNPLFGVVVLLLAVVVAVESRLCWRHRQQSQRALTALEQKQRERDRLVQQSPALSAENEQAIACDLANTQKLLVALRFALQGREVAVPVAPPGKGIDLYFDLAAFGEKTRALAARTQVAAKPDEHFGFASYANEGPPADLLPAVFRQRVACQYLVEALLEARPCSLLAVQRERPPTAAEGVGRNSRPEGGRSGAGAEAADFFGFDPALSLRVPGLVESDAFRLEFTGQTRALRTFLNTLASYQRPVFVRSVEVEPLAAGLVPADPTAPLMAQSLSKFTVVVEVIQLVAAPDTASP